MQRTPNPSSRAEVNRTMDRSHRPRSAAEEATPEESPEQKGQCSSVGGGEGEAAEPLIPGLPDEVAEQCLLRLHFPDHSLARSVSAAWNRALSSPAFLRARAAVARPYLFAFAFHPASLRPQWQALDPLSGRWFPLPAMPLPFPVCPPAFAFAARPRAGELYILGGMRSDDATPLRSLLAYKAATNSWSPAAPMPTPRAFFAAGTVGGRIVAAGGDGGAAAAATAAEWYDPADDRWRPAAGMRGCGIAAKYDAAVLGGRMYVTEGWRWPFDAPPRAAVYDAGRDAWGEMAAGMREGWTGASAVAAGRLFLVAEYGEGRVKAYDAGRDEWRAVAGGGVPPEVRRPYAVAGGEEEGRIYVVGSGLEVGVATVAKAKGAAEEEWRVEWEVIKAPPAFADLAPCYSQVLYA